MKLAKADQIQEIELMKEIIFTVLAEKKGGFLASWDDPLGGGISTQGESLAHLEKMIHESVLCHFDEEEMPKIVMSNG